MLVSIFAAVSVLAGVFFFIAGTLGLLRFGDTLSRVHALTKADNLGLGLIVLGLLPLADSLADALKLLVIWALVLLGGTTAAQLVAGAVRREQEPPP
ncbi:MAG: monovalent cation/H(+) antiporter subunit G [Acetobacteraceae bacterium]|nr:monovalent cation/H(+) antiporter subunit G [Acetobacteraceae bacterium]